MSNAYAVSEDLDFPVFLTAYDPSDLPGGSLDPLGFERGYLFLADKILPGLTNVADRPRYFSMLCAGASLADVSIADPSRVQYQKRLDCILSFERFWALANVLASEAAGEETLPLHGVRGVSYAIAAAKSLQRSGARRTNSDFKLLSRQIPYGGVGMYGAVADGMRLLDRKTFSLTPDLGGRLAEGFLDQTQVPRTLLRAVQNDGEISLSDLKEWGARAHVAGEALPVETQCLSEALHRNPVRSRMAQALAKTQFQSDSEKELQRLARLLPLLQANPTNRDLAEAVAAILAYEAAYRLVRVSKSLVNGDATAPPQGSEAASHALVLPLVQQHFASESLSNVTISERKFPFRVRADLQKAIERLFASDTKVTHFCGVRKEYANEATTLSDCMVQSPNNPTLIEPPQYEEVDVGESDPIRCLKSGLWFLEKGGSKFVVLLAPAGHYGRITGVQFQVGTINNAAGTQITQEFFKHLENSILRAESYRGKILSLERSEYNYSGEASGVKVHKLRTVERDQVILPKKTLDLLDRNVIGFVRQRSQLAKFRQATKKGLLFYGPPGTGKTHTIHYLARALEGHTTLLITAEQVALLSEYMTLARLLQPSIVVMEDVDLIARDRTEMGVCEEVILNKLLNEMDGLTEEADILFILTTNRPEALESALASRPGRVDQAIEFPLPDEEGRAKLVQLYSQGIDVDDKIIAEVVNRTGNVSAAFIKELMRRSVQFHLENNGAGVLNLQDIENALDEMLFSGGSLNLKLLGAEGISPASETAT